MRRDPRNANTCILNNLRKVTRVTAQMFDFALAEVDLKSTQFSLLATVSAVGEMAISELAEEMLMDRTTLTRNLKPLERKDYLEVIQQKDKRIRHVTLTKNGQKILRKANLIWEKEQLKLVNKIGKKSWRNLLDELEVVLGAVRE